MTELRTEQSSHIKRLVFDTFALAMPIVGLSPMLLLQVIQLWEKPYAKYLPAAWIFLALLVAFSPKGVTPSRWRTFLGGVSLVVALIIGGAAVAYFSPSIANLSMAFVFLGWALVRLASTSIYRVIGFSMLIFISLPLPFGLDDRLSRFTDEKTMELCSPVLDVFNIYHLYRSPVLSLKDHNFDVYELLANSLSVQLMIGLAILLSLIGKRPLVTAMFSILSACVWTLLGRIIFLFLAANFSFYEIDISRGYLNTMVVGVTLTIVMLLIVMSEAFWNAVFKPIRVGDENAEYRSTAGNLFNRCVVWPNKFVLDEFDVQSSALEEAKQSTAIPSLLAIPIGLAMFGLLVPATLAILRNDLILNRANYFAVDLQQIPDASTLPEDFFMKQRQRQFVSNANQSVSNNQARSCIWNYSGSGIQTSLLLKFPVRGWLDSRFLLGPEWEAQKTKLSNDGSNWPFSETTAEREGGLSTLILSSQMHTDGKPYSPNEDELKTAGNSVTVSNRWTNWRILDLLSPKQETLKPQTVCVQMRYQSESAIKESEAKILVERFLEARKILTDRFLGKKESATP